MITATAQAGWTDGQVLVAGVVILGFFCVLAGVVVAVNLVVRFEIDQWQRRKAQRDALRGASGHPQSFTELAPATKGRRWA